jgi:hypothetical protein
MSTACLYHSGSFSYSTALNGRVILPSWSVVAFTILIISHVVLVMVDNGQANSLSPPHFAICFLDDGTVCHALECMMIGSYP